MLSEDEMIQRVLQRTAQKAMVAEAAGQVKDRPDAARPAERSRNTARNAPDHPASSKAGARILAAAKPKASREVTVMPGLCAKARITTSFGALPVEALRMRDEVRTSRGTFLRVAKVDKMHLDADFLYRYQDARPVLIRAGALGRGMPLADVTVSPQQLVSTSKMPQAGSCKLAKDLLGLPGVMQVTAELVTYFNFHCDQEVMVQVEGLWFMTRP